MALLEIAALSEHFTDEEIGLLAKSLLEVVNDDDVELPLDGESMVLEGSIDDDNLVDFQDKLDANEANATVYLPIDFEDIIEIGEHRFGSLGSLLLVLDNLKQDFYIDTDDVFEENSMDDETEDDFDITNEESVDYYAGDNSPTEMKDGQLRAIWQMMYQGAQSSTESGLCLFVRD